MSHQQTIAGLAPIALLAVMYPVFRLLARRFGNKAAWYSGLAVYWIVWGLSFPLFLLGGKTLLELLWPLRIDPLAITLASIPVFFATFGRLKLGMRYEKVARWENFALLGAALGNGIFEEIFWRGIFLQLFPGNLFFGILWPSLWFGAWHYAPGSVSGGSANVFTLMVGAVFLGLLLSILANRSGTIGWSVLAHTLAGVVMVL
jgi:membrane protease YdiL (CAAX protease family)